MTPAELTRALADLGYAPERPPERLAGGFLNDVWRVRTARGPVVAKHAPGAAAGLLLSPERIVLEARALALFDAGPLRSLASDALRPPRPLGLDARRHLLVMEDCGDAPPLDAWLAAAAQRDAAAVGERLAGWLAALHAQTAGDDTLARAFANADVQRVRRQVQYDAVRGWLRRAGRVDADALAGAARDLGAAFERPGRCLTMGDLWPRSVLVAPGRLRVIDWELAHYGRPAQDVGHLRAHLWMLAHTLASDAARACQGAFERAYPLAGAEADLARRHAGCEVLIRTLGPFRTGYVYESASDARVAEAVEQACAWLGA